MFPEDLRWPIAGPINRAVEWLVTNHGDAFEAAAGGVLFVLVNLERLLRGLPWWLVVLAVAATAYHASRRTGLSLGLAAAMVLIGVLGLWDMAMQTLALMVAPSWSFM